MNSSETTPNAMERVRANLAARYRAERRFQFYGKLAIAMGLLFLTLLFGSIIGTGYPAFQQTYMQLEVSLDPGRIDPQGDGSAESLRAGDYGGR